MDKIIKDKIGIGTWALGGDYWGHQEHSDSLKMIHKALKEGFTLFDTAPVYGKGKSEQLLGQQLKKVREKVKITTKCFLKPINEFEKSLNMSLKRLNTDYIDNFFIHWPSSQIDTRPAVELLEKYREKGVIKKIGVSNFNISQLKRAQEVGSINAVQNAFNFFWTKDRPYFNYCKENNIETQVYSVLAQGLLTGKFTKENPYNENDFRKKMSLFGSKNVEMIYSYIDELSLIAKKEEISLYELMLKWSLQQSNLDTFIIGCRNRKQVEALLKLNSISIPENTLNELNQLSSSASKSILGGENIFNHFY